MDLIDKYNNEILKKINSYTFIGNKKIGMLSEKTLHKTIKDLYGDNQEVKIGKYYIDVLNGSDIIEIQTKQFNRLREKLDYLLSLDKYNINICYPVFQSKTIYWVNQDTGEISGGNKSPKKLIIPEMFYELYKIKNYLDKVTIKILIFDINEYRNLDGYDNTKKRGSRTNERIPKQLFKIMEFKNINDYKTLIPYEEEFTCKMLSKYYSSSVRYTNLMLNILKYLNVIEVIRVEKRQYIYKVTKGESNE